jgi:hypothetical protein
VEGEDHVPLSPPHLSLGGKLGVAPTGTSIIIRYGEQE